jgi:hypothetical protein
MTNREEIETRAKTVHSRIDALCKAANTPDADYFDASSSMLIATRDLLIALGYPHSMDAYRAALSRSQDVARVAEGWKLVPIEPTETMVVVGFESWPNEFFSSPEEWEAFEAMSGCQQAAHKAKLCYAAMLAAAPAAPSVAPTLWEAFEMGFSLRSSMLGHVLTARDVGRLTTCDFWHKALQGMGEKTDLHAGLSFGEAIAKLKQEVKRRLDGLVAAPAPAVAPSPVDATLNGGTVVLHFRSAEDANRFHSCASMNIGVAQNIAAPAPAEPKGERQDIDAKEFAALQGWLQTNAKSWRLHGAGLAAWALTALERLHAKPEQRAATCPRCASTTAQGCNDLNCGYMESEQRALTLSDAAGYELYQKAACAANGVKKSCSYEAWCGEFVRQLRALLAANNGGRNE